MKGFVNTRGTNATELAEVTALAKSASSTASTANDTANTNKDNIAKMQEDLESLQDSLTKLTNTIDTVPSQSGTLYYTGSAQSPTWNNYDSAKLTIGGTTSATAAGTYTATFTPTGDYSWSDGTTTAKSVTWTITAALIDTTPSQSGTLTYTGSAQTPSWSDYSSTQLTIGGTTSATAAGTYTATFTPKTNYQWSDGTTTAKSVTWTIAKATGTSSLSATSLDLTISDSTGTITVTHTGSGAVSASSSNTSVATVSVEDDTVTVTGVGAGSATITINVAADSNYSAPSSKTCAVTVTMPSSTLASNDPDVIQAAAQAGVAANYWSVGDKIGIALSGTVGALSLSGTYYAFIIGFDHNSTYEGGNTIHFQFGKTSGGTDIAFTDSNYSSSGSSAGFRMNTSNTNSGGWSSSYMRSTICPAFLAAMPSEWQSVIAACTKYSDNKGGANGSASSYVTTTSDSIWLLSEYEVQGSTTYADTYEANYQKQYTYYSNGNSKIKYRHSATSTACYWWLRSVRADTSTYFCGVRADGGAYTYNAYFSDGFAPGFKVA